MFKVALVRKQQLRGPLDTG